ncbi:DUF4157 domain-containing protein [Flavobacterium sp. Fl-318]|uniref:DUF4157 domain-containing protein n=1 Tax=Flavobacterium cupriresistens TaxID=2893885 RepID=A0ABU4R883_9FLAO|nr:MULTISPECIES: DUF4157 domain-containing protein [unclassified Flavobacterium]MDX6188810.1 DUF4157 domain-containing protein [Flavobacterium sp. Fl-318]UFH44404.1 DUF4157 domain-containing protein [Flavobacterium sp. F-323]
MRAFEKRKKDNPSNTTFFSSKIQKKLKTGSVGDQFEVEADHVADKVVNKSSADSGLLQSKEEVQQKSVSETISSVQSKEMKEEPAQKKAEEKEEPVQKKAEEKEEPVQKKAEEKEEPVQKKAEEKEEPVQKKAEEKEEPVQKKAEEKEEPVQKKAEEKEEPVQKKTEEKEEPVQKKAEEKEEPVQKKAEEKEEKKPKSHVENNLKKGGGNPLGREIRLEMENAFGVDFSAIRIHTDENAVTMCQEMGAQAFTNGVNIYFNKGKYNPNSGEGKKLLAHELTHTIQQGVTGKKKK